MKKKVPEGCAGEEKEREKNAEARVQTGNQLPYFFARPFFLMCTHNFLVISLGVTGLEPNTSSMVALSPLNPIVYPPNGFFAAISFSS